ncbi:DUF1707 domain-containing protein [Nocardioides sp. C4-1]|uniref:DUF1707 SHOCT-like domain-containing protein n=1 Tax=Nocardioides sp. C4-1 TaxID=3151851 RepID=UPI0032661B65
MNDGLRIGDVERERAAAALAEHAGQGRLDPDEHAERLDAVWSARTRGDLDVLFHDLPAQVVERDRRAYPPGRPGWRPVPFVPIAVALVVLSVVTGLPFWIAILFVGCGLFRRARRSSAARRRTSSPASPAW